METRGARQLEIHADHRGSVRETYRASWFPDLPPVVQLIRSESRPMTLRGMHVHKIQWDVWHVISGQAYVRIEDEVEYADPGSTIVIPPGLAHGFLTRTGCVLLYGITREYDGTDEYGFYPFDGPAAYGWPSEPDGWHVSVRDLRAPLR